MDETWPTSPDDLVRAYETAVEQHGESHAVTEMARMYGVPLRTAYGRLAVAGVRDMRDVPSKPPPDELRAVYEAAIAAHGERGAIRKMALATGVDYVTIRKWLIADGLRAVKPRAGAPRPITGRGHHPLPERGPAAVLPLLHAAVCVRSRFVIPACRSAGRGRGQEGSAVRGLRRRVSFLRDGLRSRPRAGREGVPSRSGRPEPQVHRGRTGEMRHRLRELPQDAHVEP